ncbi:MAG: ABC transporter permease [Acidobacteriota bacterium]|nr:ABC transporter permease [Acidobacteriota bacterium]
METVWLDIRYGVRMLWKRPGFTLVALVALALGIGANTAIFSVVMTVMVRPLPYHDADRLVWLSNKNTVLGVSQTFLNPADILDLREQAESFERVASWGTVPLNLSGATSPERVESIYVTTDFFQTLGVRPALGRDFSSSDGTANNDGVVIISYGLWQRQFGGAHDVIGRKIKLGRGADETPTSVVVGVMPAELSFPARVDLWTAYEHDRADAERGGAHNNRTIARLKPGVTIQQAQAEINVIAQTQARLYPDTNAGWEVDVVPFREHLFGSASVALPLLFGAVGCVLLIACTNVANLQLARAASRQKEIAVRLALGAGRARIIRQLLVESLILAVAGGAVGVLLAMWGVEGLRALGPDSLPRIQEAMINAQALGFTAALSVLTSVLFGLMPAWQASQSDVNQALKNTGRSGTIAPQRNRFSNMLVVIQIALALVLLVGAGLLVNSFWRLQSLNPGFDSTHILTAGLSLNFTDYPNDDPRRQIIFRQALHRLASLPGVEQVGAISHLPLGGRTMQMRFRIEGRESVSASNETIADYRVVTPAVFETLSVPVKRGRIFTERDTSQTPFVYVINESFARTYFMGRDPVGERMSGGSFLPSGEVVGVVGDVKHRGLEADSLPAFYVSYQQHATLPIMNFVMRTSTEPGTLSNSVRRELQALDPNQVVFNVRAMNEFLSDAVAQRRFSMLLLGLFATMAVILAAAGIYGVTAYTVAQRTHEIGIRVALGAQAQDVLGLVVGHGMMLAFIGVSVGLAAAFVLTRLMSSLLFGVSATDPLTFAVIALLMTGVALLACYVPARRTTKVDPMVALRYE